MAFTSYPTRKVCSEMKLNIAFDVGGTFTDIVVSRDGAVQREFIKVPTTVGDPAVGVLEGLRALLEKFAVAPSNIESIRHATTVATNAILERSGSVTALITTKGFRDVLGIGRQKRHETYAVRLRKPEPLVPRHLIFEVNERLDANGQVVVELDEAEVRCIASQLIAKGVECVAVCLLHSYANPDHEERIGKVLRGCAPHLTVSLSSCVSPKIREYERTSTTVANAFVQRIVSRYLEKLGESLRELGVNAELQIMQSSGGLVSAEFASNFPIRIVESGPAAGVLMSVGVGELEGITDLLTFDMGGTSAKLGAVDAGAPAVTATFEVDMVEFKRGSGLPLNIPSVELVEIGAGGGSIAHLDMGIIKVGPRSAASFPGPACYGRGGKQPTVTDANVVLGYIGVDRFNGRAMQLDAEASFRAIHDFIARPLSLSVEKAAWGIHALATNNMERALRIVSIERGRDPRKYSLVAFGGAGPLHASRLARQMAIPTVILPIGAGVGSAIGLLNASPKVDASITRVITADAASIPAIRNVYDELSKSLHNQLQNLGTGTVGKITRFASMRFRGQGFEVKVGLDDGEIDEAFIERTRHRFYDTYRRIYGSAEPSTPVEIADWYLAFEGRAPTHRYASREGPEVLASYQRRVYFPECGGFIDCPVYDRHSLTITQSIPGPAIIEEDETSLIILDGDTVRLSEHGNIFVSIGAES